MIEKVTLLAIGFVLTTVLGGFLGFALNRKLWATQTKHAIYRSSFDEGLKFLDELSEIVGRRFCLLQRLMWSVRDRDAKIDDKEKEYFDVVKEWNYRYWRSRNKIRLLVSETQAAKFLDYRDDVKEKNPDSLHYTFVVAHRSVMLFKSDDSKSEEAEAAVIRLNWKCSVFLEQLTSEFLKRAAALQLLRLPTSPGGAELAVRRRRVIEQKAN